MGINLDSRTSQPELLTSWYNESQESPHKKGKSLLEVIDNFKSSKKEIHKPLRVCIYDYFAKNRDGISHATGDCLSVKVESGIMKEKVKLLLMPHDIEV